MSKIPQEQVPGVCHRRVGDIVVTAISDGFVDGGLDVLRNIDQQEARRILAESFRPARRTAINAFLLYRPGAWRWSRPAPAITWAAAPRCPSRRSRQVD